MCSMLVRTVSLNKLVDQLAGPRLVEEGMHDVHLFHVAFP